MLGVPLEGEPRRAQGNSKAWVMLTDWRTDAKQGRGITSLEMNCG